MPSPQCPDCRGPSCLPELLGWARLLGLDSLEEEAGYKGSLTVHPGPALSAPSFLGSCQGCSSDFPGYLCSRPSHSCPLGCRAAPLGFVEAVTTGSALTPPPLEKSPPPTTPSLVVCS